MLHTLTKNNRELLTRVQKALAVDPRLVANKDRRLNETVDRMVAEMRKHGGTGLAAPQIGIGLQVW